MQIRSLSNFASASIQNKKEDLTFNNAIFIINLLNWRKYKIKIFCGNVCKIQSIDTLRAWLK